MLLDWQARRALKDPWGVVKDKRWPNETARPRAAEEELYPEFDETLTSGLEDTVRHFKAQPHWEHEHPDRADAPDANHWLEKGIDEAKNEIKRLRKDLGALVRAVDKKSSLMAQGKFEKEMKEHIDSRIDKIRNIAMWAIGILLVVDGIIKVVH